MFLELNNCNLLIICRVGQQVMSKTTGFKKLPDTWGGPRKRNGRGRVGKKGKGKKRLVCSESSASEASPLKRVTFDLTAFSDDEDGDVLAYTIRAPSPDPAEEEESATAEEEGTEDVDSLFNSDDGES